ASKADIRAPLFSPDGRWLAYRSSESGRPEIYVRPVTGSSARWQVSTTGATFPRWPREGGALFYQALDGNVFSVPYTDRGNAFVADPPRPWLATPTSPGSIAFFDVTSDGRRALMVMKAGGDDALPRAEPPVTFLLNFADELRRKVP